MATKKIEMAMAAEGKGTLGKADDDEPLFILRAQDRFAPMIVDEWAERVSWATPHGQPTPPKVSEARLLAQKMRDWQTTHHSKVPD